MQRALRAHFDKRAHGGVAGEVEGGLNVANFFVDCFRVVVEEVKDVGGFLFVPLFHEPAWRFWQSVAVSRLVTGKRGIWMKGCAQFVAILSV